MTNSDIPNPTTEPSTKKPVAKRARRARRSIEYQDVLRVLSRDGLRDLVLGRFRAAGGDPDRFIEAPQRRLMADCLTAGEDWMETSHPRWTDEREAVKAIRRQLES